MPAWISSLMSVLALSFILLAAYLTTRRTGLKMKRYSQSRYMRIIDQMVIAKDKMILLLKVGDKILVVGLTSQGMSRIGEISPSELEDLSADSPPAPGFGTAFQNALLHMGIPGFKREEQLDKEPDRK